MSVALPRVSRKLWNGFFKSLDHVLNILEVGYRLPCGIMERVALRRHVKLHVRAMASLVQDVLHFILGLSIYAKEKWEVVRTTRRVEATHEATHGLVEGRSSLT